MGSGQNLSGQLGYPSKEFFGYARPFSSKGRNLLTSMNNFPAGMIIGFAKAAPEEVRSMYMDLFDESKDVYKRIGNFKKQADRLLEKFGNGAKQRYQYENAITTYLWLRYPDKYYIYKYNEVKSVSDKLKSSYSFKKGAYNENLRSFFDLYNGICAELKQDMELVNLFKSQITESCYPDPELKTLTVDIGFYISQNYAKCGDHTPSIWKISHGAISEQNRSLFESRKVVVVHGQTAPKGTSGNRRASSLLMKSGKGIIFIFATETVSTCWEGLPVIRLCRIRSSPMVGLREAMKNSRFKGYLSL